MNGSKSHVRELSAEALRLPEEERLALATELIDSVEGQPDPQWESAWLSELDSRESRGNQGVRPWPEVRRRILERLGKP
jgi:hypothetical protein